MAVVSMYCSPSTNVKAGMGKLQSIVTELALQADHLIIAVDFNLELLADSIVLKFLIAIYCQTCT